jgi:hypothetical protein
MRLTTPTLLWLWALSLLPALGTGMGVEERRRAHFARHTLAPHRRAVSRPRVEEEQWRDVERDEARTPPPPPPPQQQQQRRIARSDARRRRSRQLPSAGVAAATAATAIALAAPPEERWTRQRREGGAAAVAHDAVAEEAWRQHWSSFNARDKVRSLQAMRRKVRGQVERRREEHQRATAHDV